MLGEKRIIRGKSGRKLGGGILDPEKVLEMRFKQGLTLGEIANHFGVSASAVSSLINSIETSALPEFYEHAQQFVEQSVNAEMLIIGLMSDAASIIRDIKLQTVARSKDREDESWDKMDLDVRKLQIETMREIRAQVSMYQEIAEKLYSHDAHARFQDEVIRAIREESPEVAKKITDRLRRSQPLREFIGGARRPIEASTAV